MKNLILTLLFLLAGTPAMASFINGGGGSSGAVWGGITGTLSSQTDLNTALGLKATLASPTFTGVGLMPNGSAAAPGWALTGSSTTGFYRSGADILGISTAGTGRWTFDASGHFIPVADGTYTVGSQTMKPLRVSSRAVTVSEATDNSHNVNIYSDIPGNTNISTRDTGATRTTIALFRTAGASKWDFTVEGNIVHSMDTTSTTRSDWKTWGNVTTETAGGGLKIKEGSNARMGVGTCNGTTEVSVSNTSVTASTRIFLQIVNTGGAPTGFPYVSAQTASTSFGFKCGAADTTSVVNWLLVEPS